MMLLNMHFDNILGVKCVSHCERVWIRGPWEFDKEATPGWVHFRKRVKRKACLHGTVLCVVCEELPSVNFRLYLSATATDYDPYSHSN